MSLKFRKAVKSRPAFLINGCATACIMCLGTTTGSKLLLTIVVTDGPTQIKYRVIWGTSGVQECLVQSHGFKIGIDNSTGSQQ